MKGRMRNHDEITLYTSTFTSFYYNALFKQWSNNEYLQFYEY